MSYSRSAHLFCRVIDNFGDVGVCWRLSRQFAHEHGLEVTLWVDELPSLKRLCPSLDLSLEQQQVHGVTVRRWPQAQRAFTAEDVADIVIEAFACDLPSSYIAAMVQRGRAPAWINLEYLSAEDWVEGCHGLPSPHPFLPLTKHFFFPGFTDRTGGLPLEHDLIAQRDAFQSDPQAVAAFFASLGVQVPNDACKVSMFCYPSAPMAELFSALRLDDSPVLCLVPEGVAVEAVSEFLQSPATVGTKATQGALTVQVLPFLEQNVYDRLLWACDLNFVRGEDSLVRAQWAARPFIWQIYQQAENVHVGKLDTFLGRYIDSMPNEVALDMTRFHLAWNGIRGFGTMLEHWRALRISLPQLSRYGGGWAQKISLHGNLAANLLRFIEKSC